MKKKISIGVTDFALPVPRLGSIDANSGFADGKAQGIELHLAIQQIKKARDACYSAEVKVSQQFAAEEFVFDVAGRMDGVYHQATIKIEEIKTTFNLDDLIKQLKAAPDTHPYCLQLKTYGYIHWLKSGEIPELAFHLVSTRTNKTVALPLTLNIADYEEWLTLRLAELVKEARFTEKSILRRKKIADVLAFPFAHPRPGQLELIESVVESQSVKEPLLVQAPTGLGKTIGILYPTLRESLRRGQKAIYVTPKNSQHSVAENALQQLKQTGADLKSLTLTSKVKMCFKNEPICNPNYCEYANNHYSKLAQHKLPEKISKMKNLTATKIRKLAKKHEVCPYELQFHGVKHVDIVVCDYNYVFSPRGMGQQLVSGGIGQKGKPNLIIDEFHNLPVRGMEYLSPELSSAFLENLRLPLNQIVAGFQREALQLLNSSIHLIQAQNPLKRREQFAIAELPALFIEQDAILKDFMARYLDSDFDIASNDPVMLLSRYWSEFVAALPNVARPEFFISYQPFPPTIKITCCDASFMLNEAYKDYTQVVGFSATLKPFDYYGQLTGLSSVKLKTAEFQAPFSTAKRKIIIIPQISSKYTDRARSYPRIAETISKITMLKKGNYFVFFPSFEFLERVFALFEAPPGFIKLNQTRNMHKDAIASMIALLKEPEQAHIVFAVQGGVFAEGVDYLGNMAIGAFIVGPPLPNFDFERELMKTYYEKAYGNGFDYAYTYPAMAKAVQAAGRVIRSEEDCGIIVMMDNRFVRPEYAKCMPNDWFIDKAEELISQKILADITNFWRDVDDFAPHANNHQPQEAQ
jgi:DNA excision repair protein ERCC-2